jgi:hypothetical protein
VAQDDGRNNSSLRCQLLHPVAELSRDCTSIWSPVSPHQPTASDVAAT